MMPGAQRVIQLNFNVLWSGHIIYFRMTKPDIMLLCFILRYQNLLRIPQNILLMSNIQYFQLNECLFTGGLMQEIAHATFTFEHFPEVMTMLWKRMLQDNKSNWRRTYKVQ